MYPPKRWNLSIKLHNVTSKKTVHFTVTTVRASNLTNEQMFEVII
jgi:hypothetical protein